MASEITFEALQAQFGDCLLLRYQDKGGTKRLWVIDGGPTGVYTNALEPRLAQLQKGQAPDGPLPVDVVMVSHIDDDHITGIAQMMRSLVQQRGNRVDPWLDVKDVWFNSFSQLVGSMPARTVTPAGLASFTGEITGAKELDEVTSAVLASVRQGRDLTVDVKSLDLPLNTPHPPLLSAPFAFTRNDAKVTVIGPLKQRLDKLQADWKKAEGLPAALAATLDSSVPNLSSIAMLVEIYGRKILLTGDARGDDMVKGWEANGGAAGEPCPVNVLKMPHHGSIRNTTEAFLKKFPADHYVFSANGRYDNPDSETLELLINSQGNRKYTIHVTCEIHQFDGSKDQGATTRVEDILKNGQAGRNYMYTIGSPVAITL